MCVRVCVYIKVMFIYVCVWMFIYIIYIYIYMYTYIYIYIYIYVYIYVYIYTDVNHEHVSCPPTHQSTQPLSTRSIHSAKHPVPNSIHDILTKNETTNPGRHTTPPEPQPPARQIRNDTNIKKHRNARAPSAHMWKAVGSYSGQPPIIRSQKDWCRSSYPQVVPHAAAAVANHEHHRPPTPPHHKRNRKPH